MNYAEGKRFVQRKVISFIIFTLMKTSGYQICCYTYNTQIIEKAIALFPVKMEGYELDSK